MKNNYLYLKSSWAIAFALFTIMFCMVSNSNATDTIANINDAVIASESYANIVLHSFGFKKIKNVSRSNTVSEIVGNTTRFTADFLYGVDDKSFEGNGSFESEETDDSFVVDIEHQLVSEGKTLQFQLLFNENRTTNQISESLTSTYDGSELIINSQTTTTYSGAVTTTIKNSNIQQDGAISNVVITINETEISSNEFERSIVIEGTPVSPTGDEERIETHVSMVGGNNSVRVTFNQHDVYRAGSLKYTLDSEIASTYQLEADSSDLNTVDDFITLNLIDVQNGNKKEKVTIECSTINNLMQAETIAYADSDNSRGGNIYGWCRSVIDYGIIGSLAAGTYWKSPYAFLGGFIVGGYIGGQMYTLEQMEKLEEESTTENSKSSSTSQVGSLSIPTLSEWKQIFLTLIMLSLVMGFMRKTPPIFALSNSSAMFRITGVNFLAFNKYVYNSVLKLVGFVAVLGLAGTIVIFGHVSILDITGTLFCTPLVGYIIHLLVLIKRDYEEIKLQTPSGDRA